MTTNSYWAVTLGLGLVVAVVAGTARLRSPMGASGSTWSTFHVVTSEPRGMGPLWVTATESPASRSGSMVAPLSESVPPSSIVTIDLPLLAARCTVHIAAAA